MRNEIYLHLGIVRQCPIDLTNDRGVASSVPLTPWLDRELVACNGTRYIAQYTQIRLSTTFFKPKESVFERFGILTRCICPPLPISLLLVCRQVSDEVSTLLYSRNKFRLVGNRNTCVKALLRLGACNLKLLASVQIVIRYDSAIMTSPVQRHDQGKELSRKIERLVKLLQRTDLNLTLIYKDEALRNTDLMLKLVHGVPLRNLSLAFRGRKNANKYNGLSIQAVSKALYSNSKSKHRSFSFKSLPGELQHMVLEYACDRLITAGQSMVAINVNDGVLERPARLTCCGKCNNYLDRCCCRSRSCVFSSTCRCNSNLIDLLSVDKQIREDVLRILFRHRRIRLSGYCEVSAGFITKLPPFAARYMHHIEVINPKDLRGCFLDYPSLVKSILRKLDVGRLSLHLHISPPHARDSILTNLKPLKGLSGLRGFFVYVQGYFTHTQKWDIASMVEKYVMGEAYVARVEDRLYTK